MKQLYPILLYACILLQSAISTAVFAQAPLPKQWDRTFGGSESDYFTSLQQAADGGFIAGGWSSSGIGGSKTENSRGSNDFWIVKMNANGAKQWDKTIGGSGDDGLNALQPTKDGGFILGGFSASDVSGEKTENSRGTNDDDWGKYDYWIVKVNANGIKQWDKTFGGNTDDWLNAIIQTKDGGYLLGGYSHSGINGDKTEDGRGGYDYWVVKVDSNGVKQWDKTFGGSKDDLLFAVQQTTDGGYVLGGYSSSDVSGDKTENSRGENDYWIVKIDATGAKQWDARFGGNQNEQLFSLKQTIDGGYILAGDSYSGISSDKTEESRGGWDYWIVKVDAQGVKQWDKRYGGSAYDYFLFSVIQTTDGGYALGGESYSGISGDKSQPSRGSADYWVVKTDANGVKQWDARFGGASDEPFGALLQTTDGGYILGGFSYSGISGDKTEKNEGGEDFWIVELGCPPSAKVTSLNSTDICFAGRDTLQADASPGVKFQWLKNGRPVAGANGRNYVATTPGKYRVVVYSGIGCSQTSKVIEVINSCLKDASVVAVYPNPSRGIILVNYNSTADGEVQLNVYDKTGKLLSSRRAQAVKGSNSYQLDLSHLTGGIYTLQVISNREQAQVRFIIEK